VKTGNSYEFTKILYLNLLKDALNPFSKELLLSEKEFYLSETE
jgi:hypothetical protein